MLASVFTEVFIGSLEVSGTNVGADVDSFAATTVDAVCMLEPWISFEFVGVCCRSTCVFRSTLIICWLKFSFGGYCLEACIFSSQFKLTESFKFCRSDSLAVV